MIFVLTSKYVNMKTFFSSKIEPVVICYSSDKKNIIVVFNTKIKPIKSKKGAIPIWVPSSLKNTCALIWALCVLLILLKIQAFTFNQVCMFINLLKIFPPVCLFGTDFYSGP